MARNGSVTCPDAPRADGSDHRQHAALLHRDPVVLEARAIESRCRGPGCSDGSARPRTRPAWNGVQLCGSQPSECSGRPKPLRTRGQICGCRPGIWGMQRCTVGQYPEATGLRAQRPQNRKRWRGEERPLDLRTSACRHGEREVRPRRSSAVDTDRVLRTC